MPDVLMRCEQVQGRDTKNIELCSGKDCVIACALRVIRVGTAKLLTAVRGTFWDGATVSL